MEETLQIALKIKELEECGELRVVYENDIGANALVMSNCENFVIVLDPSLSYEQQMKEIWHEAKHIYSHINNKNITIHEAENEADEFACKASNCNLLSKIRDI